MLLFINRTFENFSRFTVIIVVRQVEDFVMTIPDAAAINSTISLQ